MKKKGNQCSRFDPMPVIHVILMTLHSVGSNDRNVKMHLSCQLFRCIFGNPNCCHSSICMLSNLHPVMMFASCRAAILLLGLQSK